MTRTYDNLVQDSRDRWLWNSGKYLYRWLRRAVIWRLHVEEGRPLDVAVEAADALIAQEIIADAVAPGRYVP